MRKKRLASSRNSGFDHLNKGRDGWIHVVGLENIRDQLRAWNQTGGGRQDKIRHEGKSHLVGGNGDKACARAAFPYAKAAVSYKTQTASASLIIHLVLPAIRLSAAFQPYLKKDIIRQKQTVIKVQRRAMTGGCVHGAGKVEGSDDADCADRVPNLQRKVAYNSELPNQNSVHIDNFGHSTSMRACLARSLGNT